MAHPTDAVSSAKTYAPEAAMLWDFTPEDILLPAIRQLYVYWREAAADDRIPARSDLDVLRMKPVLGSIVLFERMPPDGRYRYRLIGTKVVERDGFDWTGRFVDTVPMPQYRDLILSRIAELEVQRRPLLVRNRQMFDMVWYDYECLWLPLAGDHRTIDMLLSCQIHFDRVPPARRG